jgi:hypothetical protein
MKLSELLSGDTRLVLPGAVFLGPFPGVDHKIKEADYEFLAHDSYVNCASPVKGKLSHFEGASFEYKGALNEADLTKVRDCIRQSGMLTAEELDLYFAV